MALILTDSPAEAGFLKNSVRVGDRSAMTIIDLPKAGQRRLPAVVPAPARPAAPDSELAWFWKEHATGIEASNPARWQYALVSLRRERAAGKGLYDAERLREIADQYDTEIAAAAKAHDVSEILLAAVIAVESAGKAKALSGKGAQGLMQLIPATAKRFGVADSYDPAQNIQGGAAYLDWLLRNFGEDPLLAIAGYNAGEGAIDKNRGIPPYAETRDYVVRVMDALAAAEDLCPTRPATPREKCGWPRHPNG